jgi:type IV pilus assembly protein PilQ
MAVQPALAAPAQVVAVELRQTANGVDVVLRTQNGDRPQVFAVNRGNRWTADVTNTQLRLPGGTSFSQANPAPGIEAVMVTPLDANSIRVTVMGQNAAPTGQVVRPNGGGLVLSVSRSGEMQATAPIPEIPAPSTRPPVAQVPAPATPTPQPAPTIPATPTTPRQAPLVPNPEITIQGPPTVVPPAQQRAIAPPVGDQASAIVDASPSRIDLGTAERIPRLVLRDAPAREVLSLLARAAGLNIAYIGAATGAPGQPGQPPGQPGAAGSEGPPVTLDIENESVQDVFNQVLRITGLEANREGRTILVGPRLPNSARNVVIRTVRLNQASVTSAVNFLVTLGAESAISRERQIINVTAVPVGQLAGGAATPTQTQQLTESRIENQRANYVDSVPILRGLQISGDERTNQVTLTGAPRLVDIAVAQLTQLDVRRRQASVNVRVIDVDLNAIDSFSTSFSFGVGETQVGNTAGVATVNFGRRSPGVGQPNPSNVFGSVPIGITNNFSNSGFIRNFFAQLQAAVTSGSGKILTDPTLVVQEGQTATVNLTEEVVTNFTQQVTTTEGGASTINLTVERTRAGLILGVKIDRIDDNGFISLSVAPSISRPNGTLGINLGGSANNITLLSERRLESGQIRLRDGQTLVLSGIIEEEDRTTIRKVPILGDLPLLGALFRSSQRQNDRREVIVLVTPRILDDSDRSGFGYNYTPGAAAQQVLDQQRQAQPQNPTP